LKVGTKAQEISEESISEFSLPEVPTTFKERGHNITIVAKLNHAIMYSIRE